MLNWNENITASYRKKICNKQSEGDIIEQEYKVNVFVKERCWCYFFAFFMLYSRYEKKRERERERVREGVEKMCVGMSCKWWAEVGNLITKLCNHIAT
jgi:hypothetical protein